MSDYRNASRRARVAVAIGVVLIVLGLMSLVGSLVPHIWSFVSGIVSFVWRILWPCALVAAGGYLLWAAKTGRLAGFASPRPHGPFRRSVMDKRFLGVCGGIAYYFGVDSTMVRVIAVILLVASPPAMVFAYLLTALLVPRA